VSIFFRIFCPMGIIRFRNFFDSAFPGAVYSTAGPEQFDHVLIDMNGFIHTSAQQNPAEDSLIANVLDSLDSVLHLTTPTKSVSLSVDGPAPLAKLQLQKERRLKQNNALFPSYRITAGSRFMQRLEKALEYWMCRTLKSYPTVQFFLSGPRVPGEGETKILHHMRGLCADPSAINDRFCLVSSDSDMILVGLACTTATNIFWLDPSSHECHSISRFCALSAAAAHTSSQPNSDVSLDVLRELLAGTAANEVSNVAKEEPSTLSPDTQFTSAKYLPGSRLDLVLLACLTGTDYLPALDLFGLKPAWEAYRTLRTEAFPQASLVEPSAKDDGVLQFNAPFLSQLLTRAAKGVDKPRSMGLSRGSDANTVRYLEGLLWSVTSFARGECCDYEYVYGCLMAPSVEDIIDVLRSLPVTCPVSKAQPLAPLKNYCALVPPAAYTELPGPLSDLIRTFTKKGSTDEEKDSAVVKCNCAFTRLSDQDRRRKRDQAAGAVQRFRDAGADATRLRRATEDLFGFLRDAQLDPADAQLLEFGKPRCFFLAKSVHKKMEGAKLAAIPRAPTPSFPPVVKVPDLMSHTFENAPLPLAAREYPTHAHTLELTFAWQPDVAPVTLALRRPKKAERVSFAAKPQPTPKGTKTKRKRELPKTTGDAMTKSQPVQKKKKLLKKKSKATSETKAQSKAQAKALGRTLVTDLLSMSCGENF
jgi:hypothetical protein